MFVCFHGEAAYALHGFLKTTPKTHDEDLALARTRMKEIESG